MISYGRLRGAFAGGIIVPDHFPTGIGRKPVLLFGSLAGDARPDCNAAAARRPDAAVGCDVLLGWLPLGIAPLYCATVPSESVSPTLVTTAVGLSMGFAELFGGVILPPIAGKAADAFGLERGLLHLHRPCAGLRFRGIVPQGNRAGQSRHGLRGLIYVGSPRHPLRGFRQPSVPPNHFEVETAVGRDGGRDRRSRLPDLSDEAFENFKQALYHHKMLFLRDQHLSHAEHEEFGARLGPFAVDACRRGVEGHRNVHPIIKEADTRVASLFGGGWHTR